MGLTVREFGGLPAQEPLLLAAGDPFFVSLTVRSYLQHLLRPHGLTFRVTEGEIVLFPGVLPPPSWKQAHSARRLEDAMRRPIDVDPDRDRVRRRLPGYNWFLNVAPQVARVLGAPILIDPEVVRRGVLDLEAFRRPIDLAGPSTPAEIIEQAGLRWWIQDEAIIVSPQRRRGEKEQGNEAPHARRMPATGGGYDRSKLARLASLPAMGALGEFQIALQ
jgi:hypothetical protein